MFHQSFKQILLGIFVALLLITVPVYAVENFKISDYAGAHQIWFEAEDYDERNPDTDEFFPVVDEAGAFGQAITRAGGSGGMIRWTFDISAAGGKGSTWYFWARQINLNAKSDYMLVEGDPGDPEIPTGPPFPGGTGPGPAWTPVEPFTNDDDRIFEEIIVRPWGWAGSGHPEGHTKELQDGENTMYIFPREGYEDIVFWDVFMWTDSNDYVPTDEDYRNAPTVHPGAASKPVPGNGAADVPRDVVLSWTPGIFAPSVDGHTVYFSEDFNDVNDGIGGIIQSANSYTLPQRLDFAKTYYWRIDEVNGPPDYAVYPGRIWSFTTELIAYPIENVTATASSSEPNQGPENTVNESGLDANDLHSTEETAMWFSSAEPNGAWIEYEFDEVYKLYEMWVWNFNKTDEPLVGFGLQDVTIVYSTNGTDWTTLAGVPQFAQAPGIDGYAHNTTVDLTGVSAKYIRLTANSKWGGILPQYGLSEVRFFYIPVNARGPNPADGATDVSIGSIDAPVDVTIGFIAGREAAKHDVYFGTDEQAVMDGTAPVVTMSQSSYGPLSLDLGSTYYWRVDEVNEAETPTTWQGDLWDFTTQEYFVLDDFESYNDLDTSDPESNRMFLTWLDGYEQPTNGAIVGYADPPFAEQTIVRGGKQSMPLFYDNTAAAIYSEAQRAFSPAQDWTRKGVGALSLWFRGHPPYFGSFVEAPAGTYTMTASGTDIFDKKDEFHFAYKELSGAGAIIAKVESVENTDPWAKAGVMIRDTLESDSANVALLITPENGVRFQRRTAAGNDTIRYFAEGITAPQWVKLERTVGGLVRAYYSADGTTWTNFNLVQVRMSTPVYIGLAVTSHNPDAVCEAKFSNVSFPDTSVDPQWTDQDVGMLSNGAEPMYVIVGDGSGTAATVYHDDPNAAQIDTWTQWNIDLAKFSDQGVNLTNVDKLSIGFGDKNNLQTGDSGVVYIDDIRLYLSR